MVKRYRHDLELQVSSVADSDGCCPLLSHLETAEYDA
jgi:hypothetical protein